MKLQRTVKGLKIVAVTIIVLILLIGLNGCRESDRVNYNIRKDADNFKVQRKVVALNTRTNEALFQVEGLISIDADEDGDLNVTIKTGDNDFKLFYAHLSTDVTYTCVQLEPTEANPYAYKITFFPAKEVIENGLIDVEAAE